MKTIEEITKKAEEIKNNGCKLSLEKIIAMEMKKENKTKWVKMSSKEIAKMESKNNETITTKETTYEIMRRHQLNNLPSSLR